MLFVQPVDLPAGYQWQAQEVVHVVDHEPHLVVRISVTGALFPHRALVPVMRILEGEEVVAESWFTEIANDNRALHGYFATDLPEQGILEFGYPDQPLHRVPAEFAGQEVQRLDRERLDAEVVDTSRSYLRKKRGF